MEKEQLYNHLFTYNEDERFYQIYQEHKKDPASFQAFLGSLCKEEIARRRLTVPELIPDQLPTLMSDSEYFHANSARSVIILKHNRCTPAFMHAHIFFEIIYVLKGSCTHTVKDHSYQMAEGELCLLSPSLAHSIYAGSDSLVINILIRRSTIEDIFFNMLRDNNVISDFLTNSIYMEQYATYLTFRTRGDREVRNQILEMYEEELMGGEFSDRVISCMLMIFFTRLVRKYKDSAQFPPLYDSNEAASHLFHYILDHYASITLSDLAEYLHYSVPYCSKYIKEITGQNFSALVKRIRFQKAENYLLHTTLSIQRISELVGYENPENFIRAFKAEFSVSPSQFRGVRQNTPVN